MARETIYVVQTYVASKGGRLKADVPISCKSADDAVRRAERLGLTKFGAVALSSSADIELGEYDDEPHVLFRTGELPESFGS
jgi:hypothetical protein